MKILLLSIIIFGLFSFTFGQSPNSWKGLILDETTPEKAIEILGKPKTDKSDQTFRPLKFNEWFDVKEKNFRIFHYENVEAIKGFKDVKLIFRNDKLLVIHLEPEKLGANALSRSYGLEFVYLSDKLAESMSPQDFERNQGKTYPKRYPDIYFLMSNAETSYIFAEIGNSSLGSILSKGLGGQDSSESLPGKVLVIQLIAKSLEETKSKDLLK